MKPSLDSLGLFIAQVRQHAEALTELLSNGSDMGRASNLMEKCIVSTTMLSGSTAVMGLEGWQECLSAFESLLSRYRNLSLPWDEKIAQVVSELIEKEELLVSAHEGGDIGDLSSIVSREEIRAMLEEVNVLLDVELAGESLGGNSPPGPDLPRRVPDVQDTASEEVYEEPGESRLEGGGVAPNESSVAMEENGTNIGNDSDGRNLLIKTTESLQAASAALFDAIAVIEGVGADITGDSIGGIRTQLCLIDFYARSMDEILKQKEGSNQAPVTSTLEPVQIALDDFANGLHSGGEQRQVEVVFEGAENELDANLLFPIERVLQRMVHDVFIRCEEPLLRIEIEACENHGGLWWKVRDNGDNFSRDSRLDHEEFLAFYPSLKQVRKILEQLESVLWVEPDENHYTRFAFTTPFSRERKKFIVWGEGENSFGVLATQLCSVQPVKGTSIESDPRGEHLVIDEQRVPLARLELICPDAPGEGDEIAIIGELEKRFAFYVQGDGRQEEGIWLNEAVSIWKGFSGGVAQLEHQRIPLIEARDLLEKYMISSGETDEQQISGGVLQDEQDLSQSQATFEEESASPPETKLSGGGVDVLLVERSDAVKEAFESILSRSSINITAVNRVEEAIEFIKGNHPHLIISEFRVPSMAAKKIVKALKEEGKDIPVLVTTSHTGAKAKTLVKKLGVSGYLSKPLDADAVIAGVEDHICA